MLLFMKGMLIGSEKVKCSEGAFPSTSGTVTYVTGKSSFYSEFNHNKSLYTARVQEMELEYSCSNSIV